MNLFHSILLFIIILLGFTNCNVMNYQYVPTPPSQEDVNSEIIKDSISSTLKLQLEDKYSPFNFSTLTTNKPKEFSTLDSIYSKRSYLTQNKKQYKADYDSLLNQINYAISNQKKEINRKKIYHTYQMDHIYIVKTSKGYTLHEDQFLFLPNFQLKKITPILSTHLTKKEKILFEYFTLNYPLFETDDFNYNHQMDQLVYRKFNNALANEKKRKGDLIHTILYCVEYIRKYNDFNQTDIAKGIASNWIKKQNLTKFTPTFEKLTKVLDNYNIDRYTLKANNKHNNNQSITFTFDLNLVIIDTTILK